MRLCASDDYDVIKADCRSFKLSVLVIDFALKLRSVYGLVVAGNELFQVLLKVFIQDLVKETDGAHVDADKFSIDVPVFRYL